MVQKDARRHAASDSRARPRAPCPFEARATRLRPDYFVFPNLSSGLRRLRSKTCVPETCERPRHSGKAARSEAGTEEGSRTFRLHGGWHGPRQTRPDWIPAEEGDHWRIAAGERRHRGRTAGAVAFEGSGKLGPRPPGIACLAESAARHASAGTGRARRFRSRRRRIQAASCGEYS